MKRVILIGMTLFALAACETVEGAGKDISKAGQAISSASRDVQSSM
ncbi:entericidin A/B family lipoprotein [Celeribacter persicus]|uniref:Entericidin B n=1 Tax=Celeribacter persicus TaxID=1651082 RepID=A0A2T5HVM2_9RHOB|nr:entericidin A/B family lipoprotein [Celeribacter persicus]PTQ75626.1 entericidin B [Celeribacter persicus]